MLLQVCRALRDSLEVVSSVGSVVVIFLTSRSLIQFEDCRLFLPFARVFQTLLRLRMRQDLERPSFNALNLEEVFLRKVLWASSERIAALAKVE